MSVVYTLNRAILLEQKFAECYERMSEIALDNVLTEQLKILSQEEISHVNLLRAGINFATREPDLFQDIHISSVEIDRGIKLLNSLMESLMAKDIDILDAISKIYDLEMIFEDVHLNKVSEFEEPSMKQLFEALSKGDRAHRERLEKVAAHIP
jgi:rubrerythrin